MKQDSKFGKLIDVAFRHNYGEDFKWEKVVITNEGNGNYTMEIDVSQRHINPATVCFQMCKHLITVDTEDGEMAHCEIEGKCPLGEWEPTIKV